MIKKEMIEISYIHKFLYYLYKLKSVVQCSFARLCYIEVRCISWKTAIDALYEVGCDWMYMGYEVKKDRNRIIIYFT